MNNIDRTEPDPRIIGASRRVSAEPGPTIVHTTVSIARTYPATPAELWAACTRHERLAEWFGPVEGEFRAGTSYRVIGNAHGTVLGCAPPHGFELSWEFEDEQSTVALGFQPAPGGGTRATLRQSGDISTERWDEYGPGASGVGWDLSLLGLERHLGGASPALDAVRWLATADARAFLSASSRAWADASITGGTPPATALAAEARTTAFYLGTG